MGLALAFAEDRTMLTWLLLLLLYVAPQEAKTVIVPNVIGLTVPRAEATLADAGLRLGRITEVPNTQFSRGIVVGQGPDGGRRVRINFECELYVSKGPGPKPPDEP
jgi:beta-lactam-binding protein with PASTA domain